MSTNLEVVGENPSGVLLESERAQLLFILALCIYDVNRFHTRHNTDPSILEASDAKIYEDWCMRDDEHDYVVCYRYYCQGNISFFVH